MADTVQQIKDKLSVADVVGAYIELKKAGVNYKARCPFHHEKTASLVVSPAKGVWHCFGCHLGGDMFTFVELHERVEFFEALKILAEKAGVVLPDRVGDRQEQQKKLLVRINTFAANYYHQLLLSAQGKAARDYLVSRGLTAETWTKWNIGFAPDDFHALEHALAQKSVSTRDMVASGLCIAKDNKVYDRFRGRITFPILSANGDCVGFSARALVSTETAKYINSPETLIYKKGEELFGLFLAKPGIRQQGTAVLVEGQMDCVHSHQVGQSHVVATSGTAVTPAQIRKLGRLTTKLVLCFDQDEAGHKATWHAAVQALQVGMEVSVLSLGGVKDPDELIKHNPEAWAAVLADGKPLFDWSIDQALALGYGSLPSKDYVSKYIVPALKWVSNPVTQDHYVKKIATATGIAESAIVQAMLGAQDFVEIEPEKDGLSAPALPGSMRETELRILGLVLAEPEKLLELRQVGLAGFRDPSLRGLAEQLLEDRSVAEGLPLAQEAKFVVESENQETPGVWREFEKTFYIWIKEAIKQQIAELGARLRTGEHSSNAQSEDMAPLSRLTNRLAEVEQKLLVL